MAALNRISIENRANILQAIGWQVNIHSYSWSPPTDVYETDASFVVRVEVAGMRESDFSIDVDDDYIVISGVRVDAQEHRAYHQMEIRYGEFSTGVELPHGVNVDKSEADYEDGFLTVVLPKLVPTGIKIQG
jgi:HSP20 family protein